MTQLIERFRACTFPFIAVVLLGLTGAGLLVHDVNASMRENKTMEKSLVPPAKLISTERFVTSGIYEVDIDGTVYIVVTNKNGTGITKK